MSAIIRPGQNPAFDTTISTMIREGRDTAYNELIDQVDAAAADLMDETPILLPPWSSLAGLVGGMPRGCVCYVGAFSGHGKTTFLMSFVDAIWEANASLRIYYVGLESIPKTLRTLWAAHRLGFDPGPILSKDYRQWPNATQVREALLGELESQVHQLEKAGRVRFAGYQHLSAEVVWQAAEDAAKFGADVVIYDHVDHIDDTGGNDYTASTAINTAILAAAQHYNTMTLAATQFNLEAVKGSRAALHYPPKPNYVYMGNKKRHVCTWMLGLYKPIKLTNVDPKALQTFNATGEGYDQVIEPDTMGVLLMKHRLYGKREGQKIYLRVEHGRVMEMPGRDIHGALHGIRTSRSVA